MAVATRVVAKTLVDDLEHLYRRVESGRNYCKKENDGWRISSSAFDDRHLKPSVDRASLRDNDPVKTQIDRQDGVALLIASEVRQISKQGLDPEPQEGGSKLVTYHVDVLHRPEPENPAHSQVEPTPPYKTPSVFKRIREALARLAAKRPWLIEPEEIRSDKS
jgi:hypothetical protein